jgi:hypothetical protein
MNNEHALTVGYHGSLMPVRRAESVLECQPHNAEALLVLAAAQTEMGLERRARATADRFRDRFPTLDVSAWLDRSPYQDPEIVDRWQSDVAVLDLVDAG